LIVTFKSLTYAKSKQMVWFFAKNRQQTSAHKNIQRT